MTTRDTRIHGLGVFLLLLLLLIAWPAGAQEGQPELDKAIDRNVAAESLQDLAEVAALCEKALEKGLSTEDQAMARQLLTGALYEHASTLCRPMMLGAAATTEQVKELRERALPDVERILKHNPQFGPAHLLAAQLKSLEGGDAQKARESVGRAVECLKDDPKRLTEALLLRSGMPGTAEPLEDLNRAVELAPDDPDVWHARARYYVAKGEVDKAVSDYNRLLEKDPDNLLVRLAVADELVDAEQYDEALKHINLVIEKQPLAIAYMLRAQLRTKQLQVDEAIKDLDEAAQRYPDNLDLVWMRAQLYYAAERNALAQQDVDRVLQARPDVEDAVKLRSLILAAMGKFAEAASNTAELLKKNPDDLMLKGQLAVYLNAANQSRRATELFSEVLRVEPQNALALRGRPDAYLNIGEHRQAVADYEEVLKLLPDDSGFLNNFAWVLATSPDDEIRNGKRAVEMALKACELTQYEQAHIISTLAAAYAEVGDFENAVKWSQKSVDVGDKEIQTQLQQELDSYRQRKPWRERKEEPAAEPAPKDPAAR